VGGSHIHTCLPHRRHLGRPDVAPGRHPQTARGYRASAANTRISVTGEDVIRAADILPTRPAPDRRRERLIAEALLVLEGKSKRVLLLPRETDSSSRHHITHCFAVASDSDLLVQEGQRVEIRTPCVGLESPRSKSRAGVEVCHTGTGRSFGWVVTPTNKGEGLPIAQGARYHGSQDTALDVETALDMEATAI
jgi:hypothetical protein